MNTRHRLTGIALAVAVGLWLSTPNAQEGVGGPPGPAQAPPVRDQAAPPPTTGTASISGRVVTDDAESKPVRQATVEVTSGERIAIRPQAVSTDTGAFEVTNLPAGRYTLSISKPGFVRTYYGARAGHREGLAIAVKDGQRVADVTVRMSPGAVITGRVTDERGRPVESAWLSVLERREVYGVPVIRSDLGPGHSDDRGIYRVYGLKAGTYLILAAAATMLPSSVPMTTAQGQWALGNTSAAPPGPGSPRAFAPVYYPGTTEVAGATVVTVRAGEERTGVDFALPLVVTSRVSGTIVRADGGSPGGAQLFALPLGVPPNLGMMVSVPRATVGPDGSFVFTSLAPGRHTLAARAPSSASATAGKGDAAAGTPDLWASADVIVSGADISGLSLTLQPGMTIAGRVAFDGKMPAPQGAALAKGWLRVTAPPAPGPTIRPPSGAIRSDGSFSITGIAPGRYSLSGYVPDATGDRPTWVLKTITAGGRDLLDAPVDIQPGLNVDDVVVTFTDRVSEISGLLVDQAGRPAPEYWILVFSTTPSHWRPQARRVHAPTRPASDGRYRITGLPPGDYYLAAISDFDPNDYATPAFLEQVVPGAIKITIGEGEQKTQDIRLGIWTDDLAI